MKETYVTKVFFVRSVAKVTGLFAKGAVADASRKTFTLSGLDQTLQVKVEADFDRDGRGHLF
jgi:hypothetical protein